MRALHLVKTLEGADWARRQVEVLRRLGVEIVVACPEGWGSMKPLYEACGATVLQRSVALPYRAPWTLSRVLSDFRSLVAEVKPDLVHSHFLTTTLVARLALGRRHSLPRVFQVPGPLHLENPIFRQVDLRTIGPNDYIIATSARTFQAYLGQGVPKERLLLSYHGSDISRFRVQTSRLREELGIADAPLIGMVAWMYPPKYVLGHTRGIKGHEDFIDAMPGVLSAYPAAMAVVVGDQWGGGHRYERALQARAKKQGGNRVAFLGRRDDIAEIYRALDVAVVPSLSENLGGAAESLLVGCPTVATNVGGLPELVVDGQTGWLVPPRCPDLLARAILDALGNPAEAAARAARGQALAQTMFDIERNGREVFGIYTRILKKQHGDRSHA